MVWANLRMARSLASSCKRQSTHTDPTVTMRTTTLNPLFRTLQPAVGYMLAMLRQSYIGLCHSLWLILKLYLNQCCRCCAWIGRYSTKSVERLRKEWNLQKTRSQQHTVESIDVYCTALKKRFPQRGVEAMRTGLRSEYNVRVPRYVIPGARQPTFQASDHRLLPSNR